MTTEPEPVIESAPTPTPATAPTPRITPAPESGERLPQMIERTRRRGRRRRAPVFTPQEVKTIDYKDVDRLRKLISDRGRIEPRRKTGLTAKDQRKIAREIKRARQVALLPYTAEHMRQTSRFRMVTRMAQRAMRAELDDAPPSSPAEGGAESEALPVEKTPAEASLVEATAPETVSAEAPAAAAVELVADAPSEASAAPPVEPLAEGSTEPPADSADEEQAEESGA